MIAPKPGHGILQVQRADPTSLLKERRFESHQCGNDELGANVVCTEEVRLAPDTADSELVAQICSWAVSPSAGEQYVSRGLVNDRDLAECVDVVSKIFFEIVVRHKADVVLVVHVVIETSGPALT